MHLSVFTTFRASLAAAILLGHSAQAVDLYWDSNGTAAGATNGTTATGTWGTSNFWNSDPTGGAAGSFRIPTTSSDDLFFSAGTDTGLATGSFTVTVAASSTLSANSITVKNGIVTISGNAATSSISIGPGGVTLASTANGTLTFGSTTASDNTPITIAAAQIWANNHASNSITIRSPLAIDNQLTLTGDSTGGINLLSGSGTGAGGVRINGATVAAVTGSFGTGILQLSGGNLRPTTGANLTISNALQIDGNFEFRPSVTSSRNLIFTGGGTISGAPTLTFSDTAGSGTQFTTGTLTLASDVTFAGTGRFTLASTGSLLFTIQNADSSQILGTASNTTANFNGAFRFDLSAVTASNGTWLLVDVANLTESFGGTFSVVDNAGALTFTESDNVWTAVDGSRTWTFSEADGQLTVIPEPAAAIPVLFGLLTILILRKRTRRQSA